MESSLEQVSILYCSMKEKYQTLYDNCLKVHKQSKEILTSITATNEKVSKIQAVKSFKNFLIEAYPKRDIYSKKIAGLMDPLCNYIDVETDSTLINEEIRGIVYMAEKDFVNDMYNYTESNDLRFENAQALVFKTNSKDGKPRAEFVLACKDRFRIPYVLIGDIDTITLQLLPNQKFDTLYNTNNADDFSTELPHKRDGYYQGLILYISNNGSLLRFPFKVN
jgi:hypothetical protein